MVYRVLVRLWLSGAGQAIPREGLAEPEHPTLTKL